jgi:hypothetical protein
MTKTPAILAGVVSLFALAAPAMAASPVTLKTKCKPAPANWQIQLQWTQGGNPLGPAINVTPDAKGRFVTNKPPTADDMEIWGTLIGVAGLSLTCHFDMDFPVTQLGKGMVAHCKNQNKLTKAKGQFKVKAKAGSPSGAFLDVLD